jgi:hypothetical protein
MTVRRAAALALLACAFALATWLAGWWGVALVAAAWGAIGARRRRGLGAEGAPPRWEYARAPSPSRQAALAAPAAWLLILAWQAAHAPVAALAARLAGVMQLPTPALPLATLLFAALLAWSAAAVAMGVAGLARRG